MSSRDKIPLPMKRRIRQRCGFGCVICGLPIYQYHHVNGFDSHVGHIENEITLLCVACHAKHHSGMISTASIVQADANPRNLKVGVSLAEKIWYCDGSKCDVVMGTNTVMGVANGIIALLVDGCEMICLDREDNVWLLSLILCDFSDNIVLRITENEIEYLTGFFDVEFKGGVLTIRLAPGQIFFQAAFKPPVFTIDRGMFCWNGIHLSIDDKGVIPLNPGTMMSTGCSTGFANVGFRYGRDPQNRGAGFGSDVKTRFLPPVDFTTPVGTPEDQVPIKLPPNP